MGRRVSGLSLPHWPGLVFALETWHLPERFTCYSDLLNDVAQALVLGVNHELQMTDLLLKDGNLCLKTLATEKRTERRREWRNFCYASPPLLTLRLVWLRSQESMYHTRNTKKNSPVINLHMNLNEICIQVKSCFWEGKQPMAKVLAL